MSWLTSWPGRTPTRAELVCLLFLRRRRCGKELEQQRAEFPRLPERQVVVGVDLDKSRARDLADGRPGDLSPDPRAKLT